MSVVKHGALHNPIVLFATKLFFTIEIAFICGFTLAERHGQDDPNGSKNVRGGSTSLMPVGPGQFVKDGATLRHFIREMVFKHCAKSFSFRDETVRPLDKADIDAAMYPIGVPIYSQKIRSGFNVLDSRGRPLTDVRMCEPDLNMTTYTLIGIDLERFLMFNSFKNGFASGRWRDSEEFSRDAG